LYNIPTIPNAQGIDEAFNEIQSVMAGISWMDAAYSRAKVMQEVREGTSYTIAKVYDGKRNWIPIEPNDTLKAFSFSYINTNRDIENYSPGVASFITNQPASLIVFANLEKISNGTDYLFNENLIHEVMSKINGQSSIINVTGISEDIANAWSDFSYSTFDVAFYKENFATFKIDYVVSYSNDCFTEPNYTNSIC